MIEDHRDRAAMPAYIETVEGLIKAWGRHDIEAVLSLLTDDVVYHFHVGTRPLCGKAWVRRFLEKFGDGQSEIRWRIVNHAQNGNVLLVEGVDDYVDRAGRRIRTPYMGVFEFRDGLICGWRDYLDANLIAQAEAGAAMPEWLEELINHERA
jgi:limonene-1,2-epoxide hydrolase